MGILVIDAGTSGVRAAIVGPDASVRHEVHRATLPDSPMPGLVEFDATAYVRGGDRVRTRGARAADGPVQAIGISNQRGLDRGLGPGDRRARRPRRWAGRTSAPSATAWCSTARASDWHPTSRRPRCRTCSTCTTPTGPGTCASAPSTRGSSGTSPRAPTTCRTRPTRPSGACWTWRPQRSTTRCSNGCASPRSMIPRVVDSTGMIGEATALPGALPICGLAGDQQSSLVGQACVEPGMAKITFGTGGMLDVCVGPAAPDVRDPWPRRHLPDGRAGGKAASRPGASRRSCCPPARTSSGSATTWD